MQAAERRISTVVLDRQREAAGRLKAAWRDGATPDAEAAAAELGLGYDVHKSVLLDLAYEEYCLRREAGEEIDATSFIRRFSSIALSLRRQICIHDALSARGVFDESQEELPEWPEIGDVIAGFLLTEELGRGAFGRVFRANEISLRERQVVVKLTKQGLHEAQLLAQVPHSGVVPVYSVVTDEEWGLTVLCMPFISRATMLDVIDIIHDGVHLPVDSSCIARAARSVNCEDDQPVLQLELGVSSKRGTFADAVTVFGYLSAEALKETHSKGIYHRDLKPSNILVDHFGCPLLIDFNLSSEPLGDVPLGGTLPYMAPEQLTAFLEAMSGEKRETQVGPTADVFSLGVCLFELLYGVHPFEPIPMELSNVELAEYLLERQALGPRRVPAAAMVDPTLRGILSQCMEFSEEKRPQTAGDLSKLLQRSLTLPNRVGRFVRSHPWLARISGGALAASLVIGGVWYASQPSWQETERATAEIAVRNRRFAEAVDCYTALLQESRNDAQLLTERGNALLQLARFEAALADFDRAQELDPTVGLASRIAYCHVQLRHYDVAEKLYREMLVEFPDAAVIHNNLGYAYLKDALFDLAYEHFSRAIELHPTFDTAYLNRADTLFQKALADRQPTPPSAIADLNSASDLVVQTGEASLLACRMISNAENPDESLLRNYLHTAISHGAGRERLESNAVIRRVLQDSVFEQRLSSAPAGRGLSRSVRTIPPWSR